MTAEPVYIGGLQDPLARRMRSVVATLPRSFAASEQDGSDALILINGAKGWAARARAAINEGRTRLFIVDPASDLPTEIEELAELAERARVLVRLAEPYAGHPLLRECAERLAEHYTTFAVNVRGADRPPSMIFDAFRALRTIEFANLTVEDIQTTDRAALLTATGLVRGRPAMVRVSTVNSTIVSPELSLQGFAGDGSLTMVLPNEGNAVPATAHIVTPHGVELLPAIYENAYRCALRLAPADPEVGANALRDFARDAALTAPLSSFEYLKKGGTYDPTGDIA